MARKKNGVTLFANFPFLTGKLGAYIKATVFITIGLSYLFWSVDLLPDVIHPIVGRVDDAIVLLFAAFSIRGAINTIIDKKAAFLGRGKR